MRYIEPKLMIAIVTTEAKINIAAACAGVLSSREAIAIGGGKIDLVRKRLDLTVRTERDSTSFFALDIPVRISGPLDNLSAAPLSGSDEDWLRQPTAAAEALRIALD